MEESVALDTSKQKQFVKSVRGIKKLLKKKGKVSKPPAVKEAEKEVVEEEVVEQEVVDSKKSGKITKRRRRGLVYLAHIPHGFYEHEMTEYFKQFGVVTNARVIRSKRTGSSKGYAFVEFKEPTVAEIVAETMNNYLMGKRLIKAVYIPPSKQKRKALRKKWNYQNNPTARLRMRLKRRHNAKKSEDEELKYAQKMLANLNNTKKKLSNMEINYDFFKPVDVPAELIDKIQTDSMTDVKPKEEVKEEPEVKPKKARKEVKSDNKLKVTQEEISKQSTKTKPGAKASVTKSKKVSDQKLNVEEANKQKDKQAKLDKAGVKALEDFIQIKDSDGDSDSSVDFDSDEYEKMIENDNDSLFDGDSDAEENVKPQSNKKKINKTKKDILPKKKSVVQNQGTKLNNKNVNNKKIKQPQKRKAATISESAVTIKNAKFEKQNKNKSLNKVMKKKK
ncbi:MKI67 FHA domain-interacting nucleolar phosphoprotein-like [Danaus plexippus]|uniref:MKI67 FHA domain-interacting nucleolar phosphoprotein-like n=1 Tax=Danaus plexippus TaxID=13037 RepID=UPI002AB287C7|nr:MKI67 FHA domain-interacting nucleolar phosphoprotein-like [Danaus plexippus]